jgi:hypothetical protein
MEHEQGGGGGGFDGGGEGGVAAAGGDDEIRAPDATRTMRLMEDHPMVGGMMPGIDPTFHLMNAMMNEQIAQSAFASEPLNPRAALEAAIAAQRQETKENSEDIDVDEDDDEDAEDYVEVARPSQAERLSDMFAPPNHLIHKAGGFQGARSMAKDSKRWLLVNIQRDAEFASHALNRDVWRDELVENLIREGFIFWQQARSFRLSVPAFEASSRRIYAECV